MPVDREPSPIWKDAPRYVPERRFPSYRFAPGFNPHPRRNPKGHSYGREEEKPSYLSPEKWRENDLYLFGVDLYHQGYLWESHEAWEALWHLTDKKNDEGLFLQALIQNAAALLKVHQEQWNGARHLSRESHEKILGVLRLRAGRPDALFMGLDVAFLASAMSRYYAPLWEGQNRVSGSPPRLEIEKKSPS